MLPDAAPALPAMGPPASLSLAVPGAVAPPGSPRWAPAVGSGMTVGAVAPGSTAGACAPVATSSPGADAPPVVASTVPRLSSSGAIAGTTGAAEALRVWRPAVAVVTAAAPVVAAAEAVPG